jgi:S-DNA-T family DNA segregation ATPase FtsK/SpoIIIE
LQNKNNFRHITIKTEDKIKETAKKFKFKERYHLPDFIGIADIKGKRFPYIRGLDENGNLVIGDLKKDKAIIVAGVPGTGKSVLEGVMLQSFIYYNPDMFHIMIDFKGGVELAFYEDFDNTICVETVDELIRVLDILENEMNERYDLIRKKYQDIDKYNDNVSEKEKRPAILVTIDEVSEIRLNAGKKKAEEIENRIVILQNKGRAALIYFLIATQRPDAEQFDPRIKANCQVKFSGRIADKVTQNIVGVKDTENLGVGFFKTNEGNVYYSLYVDMEHEDRVFKKLLKKRGGGYHVKLEKNN